MAARGTAAAVAPRAPRGARAGPPGSSSPGRYGSFFLAVLFPVVSEIQSSSALFAWE